MNNYCNALDLAYDLGHCQVVEFLLSKGAKVKNRKKVSNIGIILAGAHKRGEVKISNSTIPTIPKMESC